MMEWKLVPVEPTPEMINAGKPYMNELGAQYAEATYRAMLEAAPVAPKVSGLDKVREILEWIAGMTDDAPIRNMAKVGLEALENAPTVSVQDECGMSWDGKNVQGDKASIDAVKTALHEAGTVPDLRARINALQADKVSAQELMGFKNFHRLLCDRFDYCHDEIDWKRDQLSLIEHIATRAASIRNAVLEELLTRIDDAHENYERFGEVCQFEGQPMIYASTLTEIVELRGKLHANRALQTSAGERGSHEK